MYYTSYFANIKNLPPDIVPIAICGKSPEGYKGLEYKKLAPSWSIFRDWKYSEHTHADKAIYTDRFYKEILDKLDPLVVEQELLSYPRVRGRSFCLICYEKPNDFCHRHLVSEWMRNAGIDIQEFQ